MDCIYLALYNILTITHSQTDGGVDHLWWQPARREQWGSLALLRDTSTLPEEEPGDQTSNLVITSQPPEPRAALSLYTKSGKVNRASYSFTCGASAPRSWFGRSWGLNQQPFSYQPTCCCPSPPGWPCWVWQTARPSGCPAANTWGYMRLTLGGELTQRYMRLTLGEELTSSFRLSTYTHSATWGERYRYMRLTSSFRLSTCTHSATWG
jgi:hypothetical protein